MSEFLKWLLDVSVQVFANASMAGVGLRYAPREILAPFRNMAGVGLVLGANFVAVPVLGWAITRLIPIERSFEIGLILVAVAAGAPVVIQLTHLARGAVAFTAGVLVLLLVATIAYMPLVVPVLIPDFEIPPMVVARPLVVTMLFPVVAASAFRRAVPGLSRRLAPISWQLANIALVMLVVLSFVTNLGTVIDILGHGVILVAVLFEIGAFAIGWIFGTFGHVLRDELALITAQRNFAAATVIATQSFEVRGVLIMVVVVSLVSMAILFPAARWLGRRAPPEQRGGPPWTRRRRLGGARP